MNSFRMYLMLVGLSTISFMAGCGEGAAEVMPTESSINIPDQFQVAGTQWDRDSEMQPQDTACLLRFFKSNRDLAGSPEMEGDPVLFRSGKSDRRFYWLYPAVDGNRWRCVSFERGKFKVENGDGDPFIQ